MVLSERLLHRMQLSALRQPFDGRYVGTVGLGSQHGTGFDRLAVDVHDAGAALTGVAADVGAGEPQPVTEQTDQQRTIFHLRRDSIAVHRQGNAQ